MHGTTHILRSLVCKVPTLFRACLRPVAFSPVQLHNNSSHMAFTLGTMFRKHIFFQVRVNGSLLLDPTSNEEAMSDGSLLLAMQPSSNEVRRMSYIVRREIIQACQEHSCKVVQPSKKVKHAQFLSPRYKVQPNFVS